MISPSGNVSLRDVRRDLDLPAEGSMRERPVLNKDGQRTSGNLSLASFRGNVLGGQLELHPTWNVNPTPRWKSYPRYYPQIGGYPDVRGDALRTKCTMSGYGGGDVGSEVSIGGFIGNAVTERSWFRLTVDLDFQRSLNYSDQYWQVAVIGCSTGYLSGQTRHELLQQGNNPGIQSLDFSLELVPSRPYVVVILYSTADDGGSSAEGEFISSWRNLKLVWA